MHSYSVRDVERVLQLSRSTIRGLIDVGFVTPARGPHRELRFSFQDLIVLRTARALIQAKVSRRRIRRSLEDLGRTGAALEAYQAAIGEDPNLADCHYNLARLYETLGKPQHAIRHLGQYRRLLTSDSR